MTPKNHSNTYLAARLMGSVAALAVMATGAYAAPQSDDGTTIVVTAQKREQRLQDVPIVVTTLSGKVLQDSGVHDIKDMQILTPGLTVTSTTNETVTTARIRGVGTVGDNPGLESSVGVVIDGIYRPRNGVSFADLGEMERIEVLKGPQGTLFGKNTSAGVINIITKKPSFKFGMEGEATVGNYGAQGLAASVTGPILDDRLAGRLYVAQRKRDGYYDVNTGVGPRTTKDDMDQNFYTIRGQLLAVPNDKINVRLIADFSHRDEHCCVAVQIRSGPTAAALNLLTANNGVAATANPDARLAYSNRDTHQVVRDSGVSVEGNMKLDMFGGSELTWITGVRDWKTTNGMDIDFSGADLLYRKDDGSFNARFKTISHELRLAGATDRINWLVGAFYADETLTRNDSYTFGANYEGYFSYVVSSALNAAGATGVTPGLGFFAGLTGRPYGTNFKAGEGSRDYYTQDSKSFSVFTNDSWKVTEQLELTLGLRYTQESKKLLANYTNTAGNTTCALVAGGSGGVFGGWAVIPAPFRATVVGNACLPWANYAFANRLHKESDEDTNLSGTLKAAYHVNDNIMVYGSYAEGYKSGGFNLDRSQTGITPDASLAFAPETVVSKEVGFKSNLFGKAMSLNVTYFDQEYTNFQLNTFLGTAFVVESIPGVTSKGFDADLYWKTPVPGLSLQGGLTSTETKFTKFAAADLNASSHFGPLSLLPGNDVGFAPKLTASLAATWTGDIAGLRTSANLAAKYSDEYNTGSDLIPFKLQEAYTLVNGRLAFGAPNRAWTVEIWGQNLTDVRYNQVVFNGPLQGSGFQSTVQTGGSHPGTYYDKAKDTNTYNAFLGAPKTYGITLRVKY